MLEVIELVGFVSCAVGVSIYAIFQMKVRKLKFLEIMVDFRKLVCYTNIIVETEGCGSLTVLTEDLDSPH